MGQKLLMKSQWREIVALNFDVDRRVLSEYVPPGTQLDTYHDNCFVTMMAKHVLNLQPYGGQLVLIQSFENVSLRFYVQREVNNELRRGFCLLRSFVSSKWAARILKFLFKRNFECESITRDTRGFREANLEIMPEADYHWTIGESDNQFKVKGRSQVRKQMADTKEDFFLNPKYFYVARQGKTIEYAIRQAPWLVWDAASGSFDCDTRALLGDNFRRYLKNRPASVLLSRGGDVTVYRGQSLS